MVYNNIKSHKKTEFDPFSRKHIFGKTTGVGGQIDLPAFLGLKHEIIKF